MSGREANERPSPSAGVAGDASGTLAVLVRIALGGLFVYAGAIKALDTRAFADDIANYQLLPGVLVPLAAAALPWVEIGAGIALVAGRWSRAGALLVGAMMAVFTVALLQAFARGIDLACGCFGGTAPADWTTLVRDVALLGAAAFVYRFDRAARSRPAPAAA